MGGWACPEASMFPGSCVPFKEPLGEGCVSEPGDAKEPLASNRSTWPRRAVPDRSTDWKD